MLGGVGSMMAEVMVLGSIPKTEIPEISSSFRFLKTGGVKSACFCIYLMIKFK